VSVLSLAARLQISLLGLPVTVTNKLAAGKALLVDMGAVVVVRDIDAQVQILTEQYASTGEAGIKVSTRYDLAVTHPEAVTVLTATP
jgi:HK97 family phage major capsid protein